MDGEIIETEYYLKEIKFSINPIEPDNEYTGSLNLDDDKKAVETDKLLKNLFPDFSYVKRKPKTE